MLGAGLSSRVEGKALSEMSALKPYLGKRAVRNFREGDGNNGIMRSPFSAITLLDHQTPIPSMRAWKIIRKT
jgi:hypothetical protein